MLHNYWRVLIPLLLVVVMALAACGGDDDDDATTTTAPDETAATEVATEAEAEATAETTTDDSGSSDTTTVVIAERPVNEYFLDTCGGCHGAQREGGTGPALVPERLTEDDQFYADTIIDGRPGTVMPPMGGGVALTEEEALELANWLKTDTSDLSTEWDMEQIEASHTVLVDESTLPDEPTHDGNLDNLMLVTEREARKIAVINGDNHELIGKIDASYRAHGYAFDPNNDRWAYNVGRDGWLFKVDLYTLEATVKVRVGLDSRGIAISDNSEYVIVGNYIPHTAVILDAETLEPVKVIETEGVDPQGEFVGSRVCITSDVSPDLVGPYFILALKEAGQMWRIDWSDPEFPIDKVEGVGNILHDGFLNHDNTRFYIASQTDNWMAVIDVENWELVDQIPTGAVPHPGSGATWEWNGVEYGATVHAGEGLITIWDLEDNQIVAEIPTAGPGLFIRTTENDPYVWADALFGEPANNIYVISKEDFSVAKVIQEGVQTLKPEYTADDKYVYISDWQGNVVRVYDAATFEKVAEIEGIENPTGIFNTVRRTELMGH